MKKHCILVVEDDPCIRELICVILDSAGYEFEEAASGPEAIACVEHGGYSLILLDAMLPGIDGFAVCQRIRKSPKTKDTPVIFVTAMTTEDDALAAFRAGADGFIRKPFTNKEFKARVAAAIERREQVVEHLLTDAADWIRGGVSHYFNQPLTVLGCNLEIMNILLGSHCHSGDDLKMRDEAIHDSRNAIMKIEQLLAFMGKQAALKSKPYEHDRKIMSLLRDASGVKKNRQLTQDA